MTESNKLVMDDKYITENDIVKRYLHNKLTPEETVEFEEYIMDKPELLEQLELDSVFVQTLPEAFENEQTANQIQAESSKYVKPSFWQILWGTPMRASLVTLGISAGVFLGMFEYKLLNSNPSQIYSESYEIAYLSNLRSSQTNQSQDIYAPSGKSTVILVLQTQLVAYEEVDVLVKNKVNQLVIASIPKTANSEGDVLLPVAINDHNPYMLEITLTPKKNPNLFSIYNVTIRN
ncbi:hypothetical protein RS130_01530 [Paraglaciecola aquimarina]|uniref:Uncharacterized protein n=1 Tax=Paraglaciecola aquimarina TaxID=1235557 RepID=A0ABU3SRZ7_9ALTE|nr:hypothetical protein [Paraglaciecola aquimarina]MDU0352778.1 hypothetical protein [Paraglaciecola aquimarina]